MMGLIRRRTARSRRRSAVIALAATLLVAVAGCGGGNSAGGDPGSVTIAYQPGVSYAPLIIMKNQKVLEKQFPKTKFSWKVLSSTAAIQDAIISGDVQIGAGSAAQLILGWDKGVD